MFDFLKFPKYKVEELDNGQFIAYVKMKPYSPWVGIDKDKPGLHDWFMASAIIDYCVCDDEEEAVAAISAHTKYVPPPKKLTVEEQIRKHLK